MRVAWRLTIVVACCLTGCAEIFLDQTASNEQGETQQQAGASQTSPPPQTEPATSESSRSRIADVGGLAVPPATSASPAAPAETAQSAQAKRPAGLPPALRPVGSDDAEAEPQRVKADVGVGAAGRSLDNEKGVARVIVEPAKSLFAFRERAIFRIQIPQAMQLFQATEGRLPNSHEEFMSRIVKANNLQLPELPSGQRYVYDPRQGELMVERPQK